MLYLSITQYIKVVPFSLHLICEWYVVRYGFKNGHQRIYVLKEVGLCAQSMLNILGSLICWRKGSHPRTLHPSTTTSLQHLQSKSWNLWNPYNGYPYHISQFEDQRREIHTTNKPAWNSPIEGSLLPLMRLLKRSLPSKRQEVPLP